MYEELTAEMGFTPIREKEQIMEEAQTETEESISDLDKDLREGTYQPVPDYQWIQKHCHQKLVRRNLGKGSRGRKEYEFWGLNREPTKQERDNKKIEVCMETPKNSELKIKYRNDGQVKLVLIKRQFGKLWSACSVITKMYD